MPEPALARRLERARSAFRAISRSTEVPAVLRVIAASHATQTSMPELRAKAVGYVERYEHHAAPQPDKETDLGHALGHVWALAQKPYPCGYCSSCGCEVYLDDLMSGDLCYGCAAGTGAY